MLLKPMSVCIEKVFSSLTLGSFFVQPESESDDTSALMKQLPEETRLAAILLQEQLEIDVGICAWNEPISHIVPLL